MVGSVVIVWSRAIRNSGHFLLWRRLSMTFDQFRLIYYRLWKVSHRYPMDYIVPLFLRFHKLEQRITMLEAKPTVGQTGPIKMTYPNWCNALSQVA